MERITTVAGLKSAIQILEVEQNARERLLKEQFHAVYENLKPVNIIKNTLRELLTPSYGNIAGTAAGAASGFLLRKMLIGKSGGVFKKILGKFLQYGVARYASHKSGSITTAGLSLLGRLFRRKGKNSEQA